MHQVPAVGLVGVAPGAQRRGQVLRQPEESPNEDEGRRRRHPVALPADSEVDGASPQGDEETGCDDPAQVDDDVVGEEVEVGGHGQQTHRPPPKAAHVQVEAPEGLADVGADRGVHEAGEDRHPADTHHPRVRIGPGAGVDLEHLQRQPDEVEGADDAELAPGLLLQGHEGDLHNDDVDQQGVVAGDRRIRMVPDQGTDREPNEDGDGEGAAGQFQEGELDQAAGEQTPPTQRKTRGVRHDRSMPHLDVALADESPVTPEARRARAGISCQVNL